MIVVSYTAMEDKLDPTVEMVGDFRMSDLDENKQGIFFDVSGEPTLFTVR